MPARGPDVCLSGGAPGSDLQWGMVAGRAGHSVIHWIFEGYRSQAPVSEQVVLSAMQLHEADPYCVQARAVLKRRFPPRSDYVANLLRRNWFQVRDAQACYAIASLENGLVTGGTGWAVTMFLQRHNDAPCACYVFCQQSGAWFRWEGSWVVCAAVPRPAGIWAGIGSRDLLANGRAAIRTLFDDKETVDVAT